MKNNWKTIVLMALNGSGVNESDAVMQIRVIDPMMEEYLAEQKKELMESVSSWIAEGCAETDTMVDLAKFLRKKLNNHD